MEFFKKQPEFKPKVEKKDNCKIKIKKTTQGKQIEFEGQCSREQISIAKENLGLRDEED